jgi:ferredoxin
MKTNSSPQPRQTTRTFFQESKSIPNYSLFDKLHGYVYLRWPYLYIGIAKGKHPLAKYLGPLWNSVAKLLPKKDMDDPKRITFADTYHGKVVPTDAASQLVTINEDIRIDDLEQIIPYKKARSIVMKNPDHIIALECPCRSVSENPCYPLDVCLIIGEPFASQVAAYHPGRSRWITPDEAVGILKAERDRGHVSHAFFKDAMLERFYAICNCCECCCGAINAHHNDTPMLASSGYVAQVNPDHCSGCGDCQEFCQFHAISLVDGLSFINFNNCMGCGVCEAHCSEGAITLIQDERKGTPLIIQELIADSVQVR